MTRKVNDLEIPIIQEIIEEMGHLCLEIRNMGAEE